MELTTDHKQLTKQRDKQADLPGDAGNRKTQFIRAGVTD
jgi:hypothetical protein